MPKPYRTVRRWLYIYVREVVCLASLDVREHVLAGTTTHVRSKINDRLRNFISAEINQRLLEQQRPAEVPSEQEK
jgi:hypothetical protein